MHEKFSQVFQMKNCNHASIPTEFGLKLNKDHEEWKSLDNIHYKTYFDLCRCKKTRYNMFCEFNKQIYIENQTAMYLFATNNL